MASVSQASNDLAVVESDPTNRFHRFNKIIGEGAMRKVYLGFDGLNGMEVAWSKTQLTEKFLKSHTTIKTLCEEAHLLESLEHEYIVKCYHSWIDYRGKIIHMITELLNSGSLKDYLDRYHHVVSTVAIKNWCRKILEGLHYLHTHNPPVIHRDIKCQNIFINGNTGKVKLGDFGLATVISPELKACSGTLQFMAPELFESKYFGQLVDIYSFGMSVLQMVTREMPYRECKVKAELLAMLKQGIKPVLLGKVTDLLVKQLITKCLAPVSERPSALALLNDPFLAPIPFTSSCLLLREPANVEANKLLCKNFWLRGRINKDYVSISIDVMCAELLGNDKKIEFQYSLKDGKIESILKSMTERFDLSSEDVKQLSEKLENMIKNAHEVQRIE